MSASGQSDLRAATDLRPRNFLRWSGAFTRGFFRGGSVAALAVGEQSERKRAWLSAARLAFVSAEEVASDPLRHSSRSLLASELYRQALHAVLVSADPDLEGCSAPEVWEASKEALAKLDVGARAFSMCAEQFVVHGSLAVTTAAPTLVDAGPLREVARAALLSAEHSSRRRQRRLARVFAFVALALLAVSLGIYGVVVAATSKPDLLKHASSKTSSVYSSFDAANAAFHTDSDDAPWIEFDFGKPTAFSSMTIENRRDCCAERAVPLVVEVSSNGSTYKEVIRRTHVFKIWQPTFPKVTARYVRLRVPRRTLLHLKGVMAHP